MKRRILISLFAILILMQFSGCKTLFTQEGHLYSQSKSLVRHKRYDHAIANLSMALQIDPEYKKAILLIDEIFPESQKYYLRELQNLDQTGNLSVIARRASIYRSLNDINISMKKLPKLVHPKTGEILSFTLVDYTKEMDSALTAAAEGFYQEGLKLSETGNREDAKAASKAFKKVQKYIPNYKDTVSLEAAARTKAIQSVVFLPFRGNNYTVSALDANEYLLDLIISRLTSDKNVMEYTRIVDRSQLEPILKTQQLALSGMFDESTSVKIGKLVSANLIFAGKTIQISIEKPTTIHKTEHRAVKVPAVFDDLGRDPLEGEQFLAEGDLDLFQKSSSVKILISFKLLDVETSTIVLSDSLSTEKNDSTSWAEYHGDKRALHKSDLELIAKGEEKVSGVDELLLEGLKDLGMNVAVRLKNYLK